MNITSPCPIPPDTITPLSAPPSLSHRRCGGCREYAPVGAPPATAAGPPRPPPPPPRRTFPRDRSPASPPPPFTAAARAAGWGAPKTRAARLPNDPPKPPFRQGPLGRLTLPPLTAARPGAGTIQRASDRLTATARAQAQCWQTRGTPQRRRPAGGRQERRRQRLWGRPKREGEHANGPDQRKESGGVGGEGGGGGRCGGWARAARQRGGEERG